MHGLMQDRPLTLTTLMDGIEGRFSEKLVTTLHPGDETTSNYGHIALRIRRLADALDTLDVPRAARVASFGWNTQRHLELYLAVPSSGRVLHTINHRLFGDDIVYIVNDAADDVIVVDRSILSIIWPLIDRFETVRHVVVIDDGSTDSIPDDPRIRDYEELLAASRPVSRFDVLDERTAAVLCYTSGTTGRPKGVLYDHRSLILHTMSLLLADTFGIGENDTLMPIVPMFHANAWGLPYAAMMSGANLVMPGPLMQPETLVRTMERFRVTFSAAVTTVWQSMLPYLADHDLSCLRKVVSGGGALPVSLSTAFRDRVGIPISSSWGMTEASPLVCSARIPSTATALDDDGRTALLARPGPATPLVTLRLIREDGSRAPHDGSSPGELQIAGPTIAGGYYGRTDGSAAFTADGWLKTGDIATIDQRGFVTIVDRVKDLVKSGGEWISSVELANAIASHPDVQDAAVVAIPHDKWGERPVAYVVAAPKADLTADDLRNYLRTVVAKWWVPDEVVFVDQLPKTAVGKIDKAAMRAQVQATRAGQIDR